jgi:hypothetical protein
MDRILSLLSDEEGNLFNYIISSIEYVVILFFFVVVVVVVAARMYAIILVFSLLFPPLPRHSHA